MILLDILRVMFGLLLVFFIPGYAITKALFPRKSAFHPDYNWIYITGLSLFLSVVVVIVMGIIYQSYSPNPKTGKGYFTTGNILLSLLAVTLVFFLIGWYRGAHPWLGFIHPRLRRIPISPAVGRLIKDRERATALHDLLTRREEILREIEGVEKRLSIDSENREPLIEKVHFLRDRLAILNKQIDEVEGYASVRYARMHTRELFLLLEEEEEKIEDEEEDAENVV